MISFVKSALHGCVFLAVIMTLAPGSWAKAQKPKIEPPHRPTIGLVLEGGGALGFANIGAIEWLEQHHSTVDYLAGTSMGVLVGAPRPTAAHFRLPDVAAVQSWLDASMRRGRVRLEMPVASSYRRF